VLNYLVGYDWPGNIRELRNVAERLVALSAGGQILVEHLPSVLRFQRETPAAAPIGGLTKIADKVEQKTIMRALEKTQGSRTKAAALLGIPRSTLYYKMTKYGINSRNEQDSI
jgi:transcriptional regulator of acetoin/glycerol metabolism